MSHLPETQQEKPIEASDSEFQEIPEEVEIPPEASEPDEDWQAIGREIHQAWESFVAIVSGLKDRTQDASIPILGPIFNLNQESFTEEKVMEDACTLSFVVSDLYSDLIYTMKNHLGESFLNRVFLPPELHPTEPMILLQEGREYLDAMRTYIQQVLSNLSKIGGLLDRIQIQKPVPPTLPEPPETKPPMNPPGPSMGFKR